MPRWAARFWRVFGRRYPSFFTPVERTIADYVLNHGAKVVRLPIRQLAYECAVGESSIVRFSANGSARRATRTSVFRCRRRWKWKTFRRKRPKALLSHRRGGMGIYQQHQQSLFNARNMLNAETLQNIAAHMLAARQIYFFAPAGFHSQAIQLGLMTMQATGKGIGLAAPYPQALCQREIGAEDMVIFLVTSARTGHDGRHGPPTARPGRLPDLHLLLRPIGHWKTTVRKICFTAALPEVRCPIPPRFSSSWRPCAPCPGGRWKNGKRRTDKFH